MNALKKMELLDCITDSIFSVDEILDGLGGFRLYLPATLRQLEGAGVQLDSNFGIDDDEHAALLDDPAILRVRVDITGKLNDDGRLSVSDDYDVESYCIVPHRGSLEPAWMPCQANFQHAAGSRMRTFYGRNAYRIAEAVSEFADLISEISQGLLESMRDYDFLRLCECGRYVWDGDDCVCDDDED